MSLWENLTFGVNDADPEHVKTVCEILHMDATIKLLEAELNGSKDRKDHRHYHHCPGDTHQHHSLEENWHGLRYTERAKIHLARALIANPEVLVLQRPLHHYTGDAAELIMKVIIQYVRSRGV